jgi:GT2 family glycosyltransferase
VEEPRLGAVGPRFRGLDGELQPTLLAQASRWWTGSHAVTSFPSQRAPIARARPKFLAGAAILLRRAALEEVGAFDPSFFVHYGEVDLCRRLTAAGWQLGVAGGSTFVHVGGVATRPRWDAAYRDLLRAHLRILERYEGREVADRARRWLATSVAVRARVGSQEQRAFLARTSEWLRKTPLEELVNGLAPMPS